MYTTGMVRVVWAKLISFDLQTLIHRNYNGAHIQGKHRMMLKYSHVFRAELVSIQSSKLQVKAEFTETFPLAEWYSTMLSFQTGMDATLLSYMCRGVCGLLQSLQWCSSVGCKIRVSPVASQCGAVSTKFFSSGVPVYPVNNSWFAQLYPSVHWVNQWHSNVIPVYTGPASVHWLRARILAAWYKKGKYGVKNWDGMYVNITNVFYGFQLRNLICL